MKLVSEAEASPDVRAIFAEVRQYLGIPAVPVLYQAYAAVPEFLRLHWQAFRPLLETAPFFQMGERLAAEAYTRAQSYFAIPHLGSCRPQNHDGADGPGNSCKLLRAIDYYQYLDPLLLLITVAQMQAFDGSVGRAQGPCGNPDHRIFDAAPEFASLDGGNPGLARTLEEHRRSLELAFVPDEHRALAMWPDLYQQYWAVLRGLVSSPLYADCQFRLAESAWQLVRELPVQIETEIPRLLEAGITDEEISSLARINEALISALTGLLLDLTFLRIACEGGSRAESQRIAPEGEREQAETRAA